MKSNSNFKSGGIGFFSLLTIVFIILKLVGVIDWQWGYVLSPFLFNCLCLAPIGIVLLTILKTVSDKDD